MGATCCTRLATCDMLGVENRTSAHAQAQHCCTNLAKRLQHHATSTNVAWKIWQFFKFEPTTPNMSQHIATSRNRVAKRTQHVAPNNVAICCVEMLWSFGRGLMIELSLLYGRRSSFSHNITSSHPDYFVLSFKCFLLSDSVLLNAQKEISERIASSVINFSVQSRPHAWKIFRQLKIKWNKSRDNY